MFEDFEQSIPEQWKGFYRVLVLPIAWLPSFQRCLLEFSWNADVGSLVLLKRLFLFLPSIAMVIGFWCTMLAVYTLAFRNNRVRFVGSLLVAWWDMVRCSWFFWAGMGKFLWTLFGSIWGISRMSVSVILELIKEGFELPFVLTGTITRNFRTPGVPWLAFLMTIGWALLEATIFTYILTPTISEIMSDLVGTESHTFLPVLLFLFLFMMIAGSFACMHAMLEAVEKRDIRNIIWMGIVEMFVMGVETLFLYRELVDAISPWLVQQTGWEMGIVSVLVFSLGGWMGIRAMVWFLFGRYGTPTLLAIIARQRLSEADADDTPRAQAEERWSVVIEKIKGEQEWFKNKGEDLLGAAVLPFFQVAAATLNFGFVLFIGKPLFSVPFQSIDEIKETKGLLESLRETGGGN